MPPPASEIAHLAQGHYRARLSLTQRIESLVVAKLGRFDGWYSPVLVDELSAEVARLVGAGQVGVGQVTDGYLARTTSLVLGRPVSATGIGSQMTGTLRTGVTSAVEVYARLGEEYRFRRSLGLSDDAARQLTIDRARKMVESDLGLAFRETAYRVNGRHQVQRYRRIVNSSRPCGLCIAASDRIYRNVQKVALHPGCHCGVITVTHATDPGSQLNNDTLSEVYAAAGGKEAAKLRATRFEIVEHGELGPQLRVAGQHFRGPSEVAA